MCSEKEVSKIEELSAEVRRLRGSLEAVAAGDEASSPRKLVAIASCGLKESRSRVTLRPITMQDQMGEARGIEDRTEDERRTIARAELGRIHSGVAAIENFSNDDLLALGIGCGIAGPLSDEQVIREAGERLREIEGDDVPVKEAGMPGFLADRGIELPDDVVGLVAATFSRDADTIEAEDETWSKLREIFPASFAPKPDEDGITRIPVSS